MKTFEDDFLEFFPSTSGFRPKQPNGDDKLIRFLTLTKAIHLLDSKRLHFQRLDKFQDRNEGLWTSSDFNHWDKYKGFDVPKFSEGFRSTIGIVCWSKMNESLDRHKMLSEYISNNQGLAIVTDVTILCQEIRKGLKEMGADFADFIIAEVEYIDRTNHSNLADLGPNEFLPNVTAPCYQKDLRFSLENEVRLLIFAGIKDKTITQIEEFGVDVPISLDALVKEIWLPPNLRDWEKTVFCNLLKKHNLDSRIREFEP